MLNSTPPQDGSRREPRVPTWMGGIVGEVPSLQRILLEQGINSYT